jgi:hypothetical protein
MHLGHGVSAMFQSLGFRNHLWWPRLTWLARVASIAIFAGYALIPLSIYLRMVGADYAARARHQLVRETAAPAAPLAALPQPRQ